MAQITICKEAIQDYLETQSSDIVKVTEFNWGSFQGREPEIDYEFNFRYCDDMVYDDDLYTIDDLEERDNQIEKLEADNEQLEKRILELQTQVDVLTKERDQLVIDRTELRFQLENQKQSFLARLFS